MPKLKLTENLKDLEGIKKLQTENLKSTMTEEEQAQNGFVTAEYTLALLDKMHNLAPSVIALAEDSVVGYALVTDPAIYGEHPLLDDLIHFIEKKSYQGLVLNRKDYVLVGQLCVSKDFRGQKLAEKMYQFFKNTYKNKYKYLITDVDTKNLRSLKAHENTGFDVIDTLFYGGSSWHVVLWNWNK
jgi:ribosomal protein S18 acetylase RimI-like enzyme